MVWKQIIEYKSIFAENINLVPGYRTSRKIVAFESDDWGSIRMPSVMTYERLIKKGFILSDHYNKYDSLETTTDLTALFDVLTTFKDPYGNHPVITANFLVANPNFERIRTNYFSAYSYEVFTETYKSYKACESSFTLLLQGIGERIFKPQFHGREHLNVILWMKALQSEHAETVTAFENGFWGHLTSFSEAKRHHFLSAFDLQEPKELPFINDIIIDGLGVFTSIFGYNAQSFIATNHTWHPGIEKTLLKYGIRFIQGHRWQLIPMPGGKKLSRKWRITGQSNTLGQIQLVRNAHFEPSENPNFDWAGNCLKEISQAFFWKKPAIISCHRVNFIGSIISKNRDRNLKMFKHLLHEIQRRWPDVEFMSTNQLGNLIAEE